MSFSQGILNWAGFDKFSFALSPSEMAILTAFLRMFAYVNSIVNVFIYYITSK